MRFWYFAVSAGLLVLLVLAIQKKWRNQLSAKARYALWILPMIRLLIPFGMAELPEGNVMSLPYAVFEYTVNAFRDGDMAGQGGEIPAGSASGERSQDAETSGAGGAAANAPFLINNVLVHKKIDPLEGSSRIDLIVYGKFSDRWNLGFFRKGSCQDAVLNPFCYLDKNRFILAWIDIHSIDTSLIGVVVN